MKMQHITKTKAVSGTSSMVRSRIRRCIYQLVPVVSLLAILTPAPKTLSQAGDGEITSPSLDQGWSDGGRAWADFNGDGKADYCRAVDTHKLRVILSTGTGFNPTEITSQIPSLDQGWADSRWWADFNGDGKADYCRAVGTDKVRVTLSTGTGFNTTEITSQSLDLGDAGGGRAFVDFNGDGKADFCRVVGSTVRVTLSTGTGFNSTEITSQTLDHGWADARFWADFNGDDKADFCRAVDNDKVRVTLSTGTGFNPTEITSQSLDQGWKDGGRAFADFNGDGKADFCRAVDTYNLRVTLSTGTGFNTTEITSQDLDHGWPAGRIWADFNGDGMADYCRDVDTDKVRVTLSTGTAFGEEITAASIDQGANEGRAWADFNGDGKADYCRDVDGDKVRVTLSTGNGFGDKLTSEVLLPVPLIGQETDSWCWAASAQMVMTYLGHPVPQCTVVNQRFKRTDCCTEPAKSDKTKCRKGVPSGCSTSQFSLFNFSDLCTADGTALTKDQLKTEFNSNRPITFAWWWTGGSGHMMVATGYKKTSNDSLFVYVNDPSPVDKGDAKLITYSEFVQRSGNHTHSVDTYDIRYKQLTSK